MLTNDQRQPKMTHYEVSGADFEMFVKFPFWIMYTDFKPDTRCVYLALWSHARGDDTVVWPSIARISRLANVKRTRTKNALRELQDAGLITIEEGKDNGETNHYVLYEPSREQIEALINHEKYKALTRRNAKMRRSDQGWSPHDYPQSPHDYPQSPHDQGWSPRDQGWSPRDPEVDTRSRSKNQIQEPEPLNRASGTASGGGPPAGDSQGPLRGPDCGDTTSGAVSSANNIPASDFSALRARLERHQ